MAKHEAEKEKTARKKEAKKEEFEENERLRVAKVLLELKKEGLDAEKNRLERMYYLCMELDVKMYCLEERLQCVWDKETKCHVDPVYEGEKIESKGDRIEKAKKWCKEYSGKDCRARRTCVWDWTSNNCSVDPKYDGDEFTLIYSKMNFE